MAKQKKSEGKVKKLSEKMEQKLYTTQDMIGMYDDAQELVLKNKKHIGISGFKKIISKLKIKKIKMKNILLITILILSFNVQSQISFSCTHRETCYWNESTKNFEECFKEAESSLFEFNKAETMFIHTTPNIESTYYIKSKEYDKMINVWTYTVVSDVGNTYLYFIDPDHNQIRALTSKNMLVVFYVKSMF